MPVFEYRMKNVIFSCVAYKPDSKYTIYAVGTDKTLKEIESSGKKEIKCETGVTISQICLMHGARAIIAGVADEDKPGSIQVYRPTFEKIFEVQAHSLPIERLRITYDNTALFSVGQDGLFCMFEVNEKNKGIKKDRDTFQIQYSEEILIQKVERDKF